MSLRFTSRDLVLLFKLVKILDFINSGGDDQIEFGIFNYKSKSKVNAKPMNNDLAMLNTDTGYRDIYVYKVDSDSIG